MIIIPSNVSAKPVMSDTITGSLPGATAPVGVAVRGSQVYVGGTINGLGGRIGVFNTWDSFTGESLVPQYLSGNDYWSPVTNSSFDGNVRIIISGAGSSTIYRLGWSGNNVRISTGGGVTGVVLAPKNSSRILVIKPGINRLINLDDGYTATNGLTSGAFCMAYSHANDCVYVGCEGSVDVADMATNTIAAQIPLNYIISVASGVDKVYVAHRDSNSYSPVVSVINTSNNSVESSFPVNEGGEAATFITVSPDGNKMFALYRHLNKVQSIDLSTGTVTKVITGFNLPTRADFTDDSLKAYVANEGGGGSVSIVT